MIEALVKRGVYQCDIAADLGVSPKTVSRALARRAAPSGHVRRGSLLDPYRAQIDALLNDGVWNAQVILRALWPDAVFVNFDHGLNKAVAKIRRALGDLAESPRYVETLERRGYRFIAPVEPLAATAPPLARDATAPRVRIVRFNWQDRAIALGPGEHVIGRDPDSAVWVDAPVVSRRHARIVIGAANVTIEDLGSHNGTYVNDERCDAPRPLAHGDRIRVGPASLVVFDPPEPAATATEPGR